MHKRRMVIYFGMKDNKDIDKYRHIKKIAGEEGTGRFENLELTDED